MSVVQSLGRKSLILGLIALAGLLAGAFIWWATDAASRSDISLLGSGTLRGNGALVVPVLLVPAFIVAGIVVLALAARRGVPRATVPTWPLAVIVGFIGATATLPSIQASAEVGRVNHAATLLPDGRVLVSGGGYNAVTAKATIYDPATNTWSPIPDMNRPRAMHAAVALAGSRVLVIGGADPTGPATSELFDAASGSWRVIDGPSSIGFVVKASALGDGRVFAIGMKRTGGGSSAEIFDPANASWRIAADVPQIGQVLAVEATQGGTVLIVGNGATQALLIREGTVTPVGSNQGPVSAAVPMGDGRILALTGAGHGEGTVAAAVVSAARWTDVPSPTVRRYDLSGVALRDGSVLLAGGNMVSGSPPLGRPVADAELFDSATGRWSTLPPMNQARAGQTYTLLPDGRVLVIGGGTREGPLASAEIFDPRMRSWTLTASLR